MEVHRRRAADRVSATQPRRGRVWVSSGHRDDARGAAARSPQKGLLLKSTSTRGGLLAACTGLRMLLMEEKVKGWFADHPTWLAKYYELLAQLAVVPKAVRDRIYSAIVSDEQTREMRKHRLMTQWGSEWMRTIHNGIEDYMGCSDPSTGKFTGVLRLRSTGTAFTTGERAIVRCAAHAVQRGARCARRRKRARDDARHVQRRASPRRVIFPLPSREGGCAGDGRPQSDHRGLYNLPLRGHAHCCGGVAVLHERSPDRSDHLRRRPGGEDGRRRRARVRFRRPSDLLLGVVGRTPGGLAAVLHAPQHLVGGLSTSACTTTPTTQTPFSRKR